jgi:hypothetical protein
MVLKLFACVMVLSACLGTQPPLRLGTATPIAVVIQLESADGKSIGVPPEVRAGLEAQLRLRDLVPTWVDGASLGDARTSDERVGLLTAASDAPWVLLVEARARFFSQLSGRYRWDVELRTSLVQRGQDPQVSDLSVAAFLSFEHEREAEALAFVRRQLEDDVTTLVDRLLRAP